MKVSDEIVRFSDWSEPGTFATSIRRKLESHPEEAAAFERMFAEALDPDHWRSVDLVLGCKIAHSETKKKFPAVDDAVVATLVRAASYSWR